MFNEELGFDPEQIVYLPEYWNPDGGYLHFGMFCSNITGPSVTLMEALCNGYTACSKCVPLQTRQAIDRYYWGTIRELNSLEKDVLRDKYRAIRKEKEALEKH